MSSLTRVAAPRVGGAPNEPAAEPAGPPVNRILFVARDVQHDSLGQSIVHLARELQRRGKTVGLLSGGGALAGEFEKLGIQPTLCLCLRVPGDPRVLSWKAASAARQFAPDLVHLFSRALAAWGVKISYATGKPYVLTIASFPSSGRERRLPGDWTRGSIAAVSEEVREGLVNQGHIPKDAISVVPLGICVEDYERYRPPGGPARTPVIGTVGPLSPERGCEYFLQAARQVLDGAPDVHFLVAGDGPERHRLRRLARELNIEKWVTFVHEFADYRQMLAVLDVCVIPAVEEGVSLGVIEAMACRKPVVAAGVGDVYDVIKDGETGLLAPKKNAAALAQKIAQLIEDRELARRIVEAAFANIRERFSLGAAAASLLACYSKCLARTRGA